MTCGAPSCEREARWRVHLVLRAPQHDVWVRIPVDVCSEHRRTIRRTVLGRLLPPLVGALARRGIIASGRVVRVRFTEIT